LITPFVVVIVVVAVVVGSWRTCFPCPFLQTLLFFLNTGLKQGLQKVKPNANIKISISKFGTPAINWNAVAKFQPRCRAANRKSEAHRNISIFF